MKRRWWRIIGLGAVVAYILSGVYIVRPGEEAVVLLFGKLATAHPVAPGVHWRLPFPFGRVIRVRVMERRRVAVGMELPDATAGRVASPRQVQFLTGDINVVNLGAVIQFRISDSIAYVIRCQDADLIVKELAQTALMQVVAGATVDDVLTIGKPRIQSDTRSLIQQLATQYRTGIYIISVNLQLAQPPAEVADAFHDVTRAREERQKLINEAYSYQNERIPQARGEAERIIAEAQAYKVRLINRAKGDAERFIAMAREYRKSPRVTSARIYIEAMEEILPRMKKYVVDADLRKGRRLDLTLFEPAPAKTEASGKGQSNP